MSTIIKDTSRIEHKILVGDVLIESESVAYLYVTREFEDGITQHIGVQLNGKGWNLIEYIKPTIIYRPTTLDKMHCGASVDYLDDFFHSSDYRMLVDESVKEVTLAEIAEKFGIPVERLRIIA